MAPGKWRWGVGVTLKWYPFLPDYPNTRFINKATGGSLGGPSITFYCSDTAAGKEPAVCLGGPGLGGLRLGQPP